MKARLLIIDDDAAMQQVMAGHLENSGYEVISVADSLSAVEAFKHLEPGNNNPIALVICDLSIAAENNFKLLHSVKKAAPQLPFIVTVAVKSITEVVPALRIGASDYLVKPFVDLFILEHSVRHNLDQAALELQNSQYRSHLEQANQELRTRLDELNRDQQAGRQVQIKMLPEPYQSEDLTITHSIKPSLILSGDFIDYFALGDEHIGFYLADVAGHGASSAFMTVLLKNLTHRLKRNLKRDATSDLFYPENVLSRMNKELLDTGCSKHLTIIYGVYNPQTRQLNYSIGGHLPMPILYHDGKAEYLTGKGMPVGLFNDALYNPYQITLPKHFTLSLFSDGVLEVLSKPVLGLTSLAMKEQYLLNLIEQHAGKHESIIQALALDGDDSVSDDVALLTVVGI